MTCFRFIIYNSRVINKLFNTTMQKLSAKLEKRALTASLKKGGSEATATFASLNIHTRLYILCKCEQ